MKFKGVRPGLPRDDAKHLNDVLFRALPRTNVEGVWPIEVQQDLGGTTISLQPHQDRDVIFSEIEPTAGPLASFIPPRLAYPGPPLFQGLPGEVYYDCLGKQWQWVIPCHVGGTQGTNLTDLDGEGAGWMPVGTGDIVGDINFGVKCGPGAPIGLGVLMLPTRVPCGTTGGDDEPPTWRPEDVGLGGGAYPLEYVQESGIVYIWNGTKWDGLTGGNITVPTKFNNTVTVNKPLTVNDTTTFTKPVTVTDTLTLNNNVTTNTVGTVTVNKPVTVNAAVTVTDTLTLNNNVTTNTVGTVTVNKPVTLNAAVTVTGLATLSGGVTVTGLGTFNNGVTVTGLATLNTGVTVTGLGTFNNALTVTGLATLAGGVTVDGLGKFTDTTNPGEIRLLEAVANGTDYVALVAPSALAASTVYTLPTALPAVSGDVLSCTTGGVMSWAAGGGGSGPGTSTPGWVKAGNKTWTYADFNNASTSHQYAIYSLPAKTVVLAACIRHSASFTGGTVSACTIFLEPDGSGAPGPFTNSLDVFQAPGDQVYQYNQDQSGEGVQNFGSAVNVLAAVTTTGDTQNHLTAGAVDIWLLLSTLP